MRRIEQQQQQNGRKTWPMVNKVEIYVQKREWYFLSLQFHFVWNFNFIQPGVASEMNSGLKTQNKKKKNDLKWFIEWNETKQNENNSQNHLGGAQRPQ